MSAPEPPETPKRDHAQLVESLRAQFMAEGAAAERRRIVTSLRQANSIAALFDVAYRLAFVDPRPNGELVREHLVHTPSTTASRVDRPQCVAQASELAHQ